MRIVTVLAALLISICAATAAAADKPCTKADATRAQKALDGVFTWPQLHKAWQDYRYCDADATAELFTEALMRLIVDWKDVETFASTTRKDPQFKEFVLAHFRSPAAKDDLEDVYARAKTRCPKGLDEFCAEIADAARKK
jgi:hypothetical protein